MQPLAYQAYLSLCVTCAMQSGAAWPGLGSILAADLLAALVHHYSRGWMQASANANIMHHTPRLCSSASVFACMLLFMPICTHCCMATEFIAAWECTLKMHRTACYAALMRWRSLILVCTPHDTCFPVIIIWVLEVMVLFYYVGCAALVSSVKTHISASMDAFAIALLVIY